MTVPTGTETIQGRKLFAEIGSPNFSLVLEVLNGFEICYDSESMGPMNP